jgi:hypothetical protein
MSLNLIWVLLMKSNYFYFVTQLTGKTIKVGKLQFEGYKYIKNPSVSIHSSYTTNKQNIIHQNIFKILQIGICWISIEIVVCVELTSKSKVGDI